MEHRRAMPQACSQRIRRVRLTHWLAVAPRVSDSRMLRIHLQRLACRRMRHILRTRRHMQLAAAVMDHRLGPMLERMRASWQQPRAAARQKLHAVCSQPPLLLLPRPATVPTSTTTSSTTSSTIQLPRRHHVHMRTCKAEPRSAIPLLELLPKLR